MSAVRVRRANSDDYAVIDTLIEAAYAHDYGPSVGSSDPMRASEVRDRNFEVWIAENRDGELLGSVTLRERGGSPLHEDISDTELDIRLLGVSPRARRLGVGALLMRHAADRAAATGFAAVVLKTAPNMLPAHRLYEALGYTRAPERDGLWIGGEKIIDLFTYVLPVAPATESGLEDAEGVDGTDSLLPRADIANTDDARAVLGTFPSGVIVVTGGADEDVPAALVVQSFVSLSIDPPRILLSVGKGSTSWPRIASGGTFAATVLADDQGQLARTIARSVERDKLAGIPSIPSPAHGHPVVQGGSAWLECEVREEFDGGDHRIIVAEVLNFGRLPRADVPLVFVGSRFTGVAPLAPSGE